MIETKFQQWSPLLFSWNLETYAFYIKNKFFFWAEVFFYLNSVKSKGLVSIVNAPAQIIVTAPSIKNLPPSIATTTATTTTTNSRKIKSKSFIQPIPKSFYWWEKNILRTWSKSESDRWFEPDFLRFWPSECRFLHKPILSCKMVLKKLKRS